MPHRDDEVRLRDMLDAARAALAAIRGRDRADLDQNSIWALGLVKCLEIVGEATNRLSPEMRERWPDIPWREIVGMRNRLVHTYFDIDRDQVWQTLKEDLPPLVGQLEAVLSTEFPEA